MNTKVVNKPFTIHYSRVFRSNIMYTREDLVDNIKTWNGKDQCYVSLNEFEVIDGSQPAWNYAIFDRLLIECDITVVKQLRELMKNNNFQKKFNFSHSIWYIGDNKFYWFFILPEEKDKIFPLVEEVETVLKEESIEASINRKPDKKILMLGTYNLLTKRVVVPISDDDLAQGLVIIDKKGVIQ